MIAPVPLTVNLPPIGEEAAATSELSEADMPSQTPPACIALASALLIRHICMWCCNPVALTPGSVCASCQVQVDARNAEDAADQRWLGEHCAACGQCNFECACAPVAAPATHYCMMCHVATVPTADSVCAPCQVHLDAENAEAAAYHSWLDEQCAVCSQKNSACECSERHDNDDDERRHHTPRCRGCGCSMEDGTEWWDVCSRSCNRDVHGRFGY